MSGIIGGAGSKSGVIGETEIDYEEGTWTPALYGNSNGSDPNGYGYRSGFYTKIGRLVTCQFYLHYNSVGTNSGSYMVLKDLPFVQSAAWWGGVSSVLLFQNNASNSLGMGLQIADGNNFCYVYYFTSSGSSITYFPVSGGLGSTSKITGALTYFTA